MSCGVILRMTDGPVSRLCPDPGVHSVTAARDGHRYVVSYCDRSMSAIALGDYSDNTVKVILVSDSETLYERPVLASDGKILFISRQTESESMLCAVTIDGTGLARLLPNDAGEKSNVLDFTLSKNEETVYYVNSEKFTNFSPLARPAPHKQDLYSLSRATGQIKRLSFGKEYALPGIAISLDEKKIYSHYRLFQLNKDQVTRRIGYGVEPSLGFFSKSLVYTSTYPLSAISSSNEMVMSSGKAIKFDTAFNVTTPVVRGYGLYLVRLPEMDVVKELVYLPSYLDSPAYLEAEDTILFIRIDKVYGGKNGRELWAVKRDGSGLKKIDLKLPVQ